MIERPTVDAFQYITMLLGCRKTLLTEVMNNLPPPENTLKKATVRLFCELSHAPADCTFGLLDCTKL